MTTRETPRPTGFFAMGVFLLFGATMATFAAITLLRPGTILDRAWALNPTAHSQMLSLCKIVGFPFIILAIVLFLAGVDWLWGRYWGWLLGASLIAINLAADITHAFLNDVLKSVVGVVVASLLLFYMGRPAVRNYFLSHLDSHNGNPGQ